MNDSIIKREKEQIRALIDAATSIGIIVGENQTLDIVAASLALYLILKNEGRNVQIISKKDPLVEVSNLFGVNKIAKSFDGVVKTLTISVPYREGEIEKVSYNIEKDRLNVNLFAEENGITFNEDDVDYIRKGSSPSLIITVGVTDEQELVGLADINQVQAIHIDKNPLNSLMGDIPLISPVFSSLSEVVAVLIMELGYMPDTDAFQNLLDGIMSETANFSAPNTSALAFEAAGFLLQNGARRKEVQIERPRPIAPQPRRDNNFPREELFLRDNRDNASQQPRPQRPHDQRPARNNQPGPRPQPQHVRPNNNQQQPRPQRQPQMPPIPNTMPQNWPNIPSNAQNTPKETGYKDSMDEVSNPFVEGSMPEEIPDDWFLPKVFKGSKKGN
ncbi:MAG TPA: hypothetical protein VHE53_02610 [Patescibacteria group bacterium]|nr:hypothetical protein [Patescibacteria group bacterium]